MFRDSKGITLITLMITIVVLIILTAITLSFVLGNEGILEKTVNAVDKNRIEEVKEEIRINCDRIWYRIL